MPLTHHKCPWVGQMENGLYRAEWRLEEELGGPCGVSARMDSDAPWGE